MTGNTSNKQTAAILQLNVSVIYGILIPDLQPLSQAKTTSFNLFRQETKAQFKRQTLHVPNLIIRFGTCKVRRLNQLGLADLYLGRPAVLFGRACRIERQKIDLVSNVEL